ncbi:T6SS effector BTH_I2691 family protein [Lysobacter cavernae]|uniref:T6SS effector BTH_I2691 family protein n=1 Tax=Lysobacter cavernae TaxID=1685901 RepID=A0ABV7RWU3_9GAMM
MNDPAATKCPFCDKVGLPILPVRYAIAYNDDKRVKQKAPKLQAPFGQGVDNIPLPSKQAQYTLRLLRPGYLYVFNEKRGEWSAYVVTEAGFLYQFDVHAKSPPASDSIEFSCSRTGDEQIARCITIPDASSAGKVWLGYTDTAWTPNQLQKHRTQGYREKHMRCIDVSASTQQPHTAEIAKIQELVSEFVFKRPEKYAPEKQPWEFDHLKVVAPSTGQSLPSGPWSTEYLRAHSQAQQPGAATQGPPQSTVLDEVIVTNCPAFDFSLHDFKRFGQDAKALIDWAEQAAAPTSKKPLVTALLDPAGLAMELASLMSDLLAGVMRNPAHERPLAVSSAISSLEQAIKNQAEFKAIRDAQISAHNAMDVGYMTGGDGAAAARGGQALADYFFPDQAKKRKDTEEWLAQITPQQLNEAADEEWEGYAKKFRAPDLQAWRSRYHGELKQLDQDAIIPLAHAHKTWMLSNELLEHFDCNHDDTDAHSGQGFVDTLTLCIQDTQHNTISFKLYSAWLNATEIKRDNLVLRALAYNQQSVLQQLNQAAKGGLDPSFLKGLPWDGLITGYDKAIEALAAGGTNAVVRFTSALGGPLMKLIDTAADRVAGPALIATGLVSKAPVIAVEWDGYKYEAIKELVSRMKAVNPNVGSVRDVERAIDLEMRRANIRGVPLNAKGRFRYLILADKQVVADFPQSLPNATPRKLAEASILSQAEYQQKTQLRWKKLMPANVRLGVVAGLFQTVALTKLAKDVDQGMQHERKENQWRFTAGTLALAGTLAEMTGNWMESASGAGNRSAVYLNKLMGKFVRFAGKALGLVAGAIMAVWDGMRAGQEWREGNEGVAVLYALSAFAGIGAVVAFSTWGGALLGAAATGVGLILVAVAILIAVLIEVFKDDKLQDWIERCYFGKFDASDRYRDAEVEMKELKIAMEG